MQKAPDYRILLEISYQQPDKWTLIGLNSGQTYSLPKRCTLPTSFQTLDEQKFGNHVLIYRNIDDDFKYYRLSINCPTYISYCWFDPVYLIEGKQIPGHYMSTTSGYTRNTELNETVQRIMPLIESKSYLVATNNSLHIMYFGGYDTEPKLFVV